MSNASVEQSLGQFFNFFRERLASAEAQPGNVIEGYVLALTTLDALANCESGLRSNAENFSNFILRYSGLHETYNKVSVPLLVQYLGLKKPKSFGAITSWLRTKYVGDSYKPKRVRQLNEDPSWEVFWGDLQASGLQIPSGAAKELQRYRYAGILWDQYRNHAIHRLTIRDEATNFLKADKSPYYGVYESVGHAQFDCGQIGFSCLIAPLVMHRDISALRVLPVSLIVNEISRALENPELDTPSNMSLDPAARWDDGFGMLAGKLTVSGQEHQWTLSIIFDTQWVNFGIPRVFILKTLANAVDNLQRESQHDPDLAARLWLNSQRRLV